MDGPPFESAVTNEVDKRLEHRECEDQDCEEPKGAERLVRNGKWVEEDQFDIEHDEDHGDQEEANWEAFRGVLRWLDAALIGRVLLVVRPLRRKHLVHRKAERSEQYAEHSETYER